MSSPTTEMQLLEKTDQTRHWQVGTCLARRIEQVEAINCPRIISEDRHTPCDATQISTCSPLLLLNPHIGPLDLECAKLPLRKVAV